MEEVPEQPKKTRKATKPCSKEEKNNSPETLSVLLKKYTDTQDNCQGQIDRAKDLICQARIKPTWKEKFIRTGGNKTEIELAAHNAANYLEGVTNQLDQTICEIEAKKDKARDFAINCFAYLNKIHQGSCIGEAGKIIIDLFEKGELCTEMMEVLMGEAEQQSKDKNLPFANKLTDNQKKALEFMTQEKEERISPVLNSLQAYNHLCAHMENWNPLLDALVKEDVVKAQRIIKLMP